VALKTWGIAVIGCGTIADFHIQAVKELPNANLVAISDRKEPRAREIGEREQCYWTTDYKNILRHPDVDVVCLTTGSGSHGSIGLEVLEAGKHLLVEKPIAMTSKEAVQMIRTAEREEVYLSVVSQRRFEYQHQRVKEAVETGAIGKLLFVEVSCPYYRSQEYYDSSSWRGTMDQDGGALMNQGIHSIDLMLWIGGAVDSVIGKTATQVHRMEAEDMGVALLTFKNGAFGSLMSSTNIQPGFPPVLNIYGEKGTIKMEGTDITHWTVPDVPKPENKNDASSGGGVSDPKAISNLYHRLQLADFLEALTAGGSPGITGLDGLKSVELIEAIYKSSAQWEEIKLGVEP
jgi:UDP-N-acetyl-2-amino-2-deoxyglucuronate dehydrogenase